MKNITKFFALAVVILGFSATSFAQESISTLTAEATVVVVAEVTDVTNLNFGSIGSDLAGGDVTMSTDGVRGGTATLLMTDEGEAGAFTITGTIGNTVNLIMPLGETTLTSGTDEMTILTGDFVFNIGASGDDVNGFLMDDSFVIVKIGATLQVGAVQPAGSYLGTYDITIALN